MLDLPAGQHQCSSLEVVGGLNEAMLKPPHKVGLSQSVFFTASFLQLRYQHTN